MKKLLLVSVCSLSINLLAMKEEDFEDAFEPMCATAGVSEALRSMDRINEEDVRQETQITLARNLKSIPEPK